MAGITNIQVQAALHFDDGYVITISTPLWHKDIRDGDYFNAELTQEVLAGAGQALAGIIESEGVHKLHGRAVAACEAHQDRRRPTPIDPFSIN